MRSTPRLSALLMLLAAVTFAACIESSTVSEITPEELRDAPPAGSIILDVRTPEEYAAGHVPGAVNIPHDQLGERLDELDAEADAPLIVYCERGGRAGQALSLLLDEGYRDLRHLQGDMQAWRAMEASGSPE